MTNIFDVIDDLFIAVFATAASLSCHCAHLSQRNSSNTILLYNRVSH